MKKMIVICGLIIIIMLSFLFFWGGKRVNKRKNDEMCNGNSNKDTDNSSRGCKRPLFTGNNKWKIIPYYKDKVIDAKGYSFGLFDVVYGNEDGNRTAFVILSAQNKTMEVCFNVSDKKGFCPGCIAFIQDAGLVFYEYEHKHKENNYIYEMSYTYPGDKQMKKASDILIKDGTVIRITKINNPEEEWKLEFHESIAEYKKRL